MAQAERRRGAATVRRTCAASRAKTAAKRRREASWGLVFDESLHAATKVLAARDTKSSP